MLVACVLCAACSKPATPPPLVAQTSGTFAIAGLSAPVRVVRDTWGVPHIYAESQADLFIAQGFVQAEDRLFQMDLWKKAAQGRLSQVLGPNFIARDAMTRRFQYRGDADVEWASYGDDARAIAGRFVQGVNAWVDVARQRLPEAFAAAGWPPEYWRPEDLLNRTDAFLASGDALDEVARRHLNGVVADAIRRMGTAPFFVALARPVHAAAGEAFPAPDPPANAARVRSTPLSADGAAASPGLLRVVEAGRNFTAPSSRYLVHLHGAGWNVIGATRPWLPGIAVGHNDRIAWAQAPLAADTEDVYADPAASIERPWHREAIVVKASRIPFVFDVQRTTHGIVIASDRAHDIAFALKWSGTEPGAAAELGALALDRARSWEEFRLALRRWKMPVRRMLYADAANAGFEDAGLVPVRRGAIWAGWEDPDARPHAIGRSTVVAPAAVRGATDARAGSAAGPLVVFDSVLGVTAAARRRFDAGPFAAPGGDDAPVQAVFDAGRWDASQAIDAPGQSESPSSPHVADLAGAWSAGRKVPLLFTDEAVRAAAHDTLTLVPAGR
jgi:penicillin amidase